MDTPYAGDMRTAILKPALSGEARHPRLRNAVTALVFIAVMTTGIHSRVNGVQLSLERIVGLALLPVLVGAVLRTSSFNAARAPLFLWFWWCVIETLSAVFSSDLLQHLTFLLIAYIPTAVFAFFTVNRMDANFVDRCVRYVLWTNGIASIIVAGVYSLYGGAGLTLAFASLVGDAGRLSLLVSEPNLFGSGIAFMILLALPRVRWRTLDSVMLVLAFVALLLARSRGPLIGFVVGTVAYLILTTIASRRSVGKRFIIVLWAIIIAAMVFLIFSNQAGDIYASQLQRGDTIRVRQYFLNEALDRFYGAPILGRGPGDFSLQDPSALRLFGGDAVGENMWIWQMFVNIMHDSGLIGLAIYASFLFMLIRVGFIWIRRGSKDHCGYMAAFLSILVASQTSTVHLNAIFGLASGLLISAPYALNRSRVASPAVARRSRQTVSIMGAAA